MSPQKSESSATNSKEPSVDLGAADSDSSESRTADLDQSHKNSANGLDKTSSNDSNENSKSISTEKKETDTKPSKQSQAGSQPAASTAESEKAQYLKLRASLKNIIAKRKELDRKLEEIEEKIHVDEGSYLTKATAGNIVKGFDQYTRTSQNRRKSVFTDADRIFSQGSTTFDAEM